VAAVGAADDIGASRDSGSDKMHVVGVELSADDAQLCRQVRQKVCAGLPGQVIHDLADWPVMKPRLVRQRAADRRGGDAIGVEECPERIQELLDDGDLVLHAAKTLERVAHELHPDDFGREALDDDAFGGKLEESISQKLPWAAAASEASAASWALGCTSLSGRCRQT